MLDRLHLSTHTATRFARAVVQLHHDGNRGAAAPSCRPNSPCTAMTSSLAFELSVNLAMAHQGGRSASRTMRTVSATRSPTDSPVSSGVMENAAIILDIVPLPDPNSYGQAGAEPWPMSGRAKLLVEGFAADRTWPDLVRGECARYLVRDPRDLRFWENFLHEFEFGGASRP